MPDHLLAAELVAHAVLSAVRQQPEHGAPPARRPSMGPTTHRAHRVSETSSIACAKPLTASGTLLLVCPACAHIRACRPGRGHLVALGLAPRGCCVHLPEAWHPRHAGPEEHRQRAHRRPVHPGHLQPQLRPHHRERLELGRVRVCQRRHPQRPCHHGAPHLLPAALGAQNMLFPTHTRRSQSCCSIACMGSQTPWQVVAWGALVGAACVARARLQTERVCWC